MTSHDADHVRRAYDEVRFDDASGHQMVAGVRRTVRRRRRNRTAAVGAGVVATVVVGIASATAWTGREPSPADVPDTSTSSLTITTPDGRATELTGFTARCVEADPGEGAPKGVLVVDSTDAGTDTDTGADGSRRAVLRFQGDVTDLVEAGIVTFPVDESDPDTPRLVELFAAVDTAGFVLEATTTSEVSSGTIVVRGARCGDDPSLYADIDLTLGTEGDPGEGLVRVTGTLRVP